MCEYLPVSCRLRRNNNDRILGRLVVNDFRFSIRIMNLVYMLIKMKVAEQELVAQTTALWTPLELQLYPGGREGGREGTHYQCTLFNDVDM